MRTNEKTGNETRTPILTPWSQARPTLSPTSRLTILGALVLTLCGCTVLTYESPTGERFSRSSVGSTTAISCLRIEAETNGTRRVEMRGYQNDTAQAAGAVTEAAVRAAIQSVQ